MPSSRQLAAIMFTDIVGYTTLMGSNEKKAFDLLRKNREVQKPLIKQFNGRWIKEIGDGVLASFNTISDAVMCAGSIHRASASVEGLQLRIGIHLGEVVFENMDVFGDGVNIAARLQAMAPIGGTLISESVYKNVMNKSEFITTYIGEEKLKNINEPVKIYEIKVNPEAYSNYQLGKKETGFVKSHQRNTIIIAGLVLILIAISSRFLIHNKISASTGKQAIEKSIAVLPFVNMSNDPQQDYFSDGLSEELINMFSRLPELKVIGRTSSFAFKGKNEDLRNIGKELDVAYLLEGSVRKSGNVIRITAQLIKADDGTHIWSESYDREMTDIFKIQSEIAGMIAQKFEIAMTPETNAKLNESPTKNVEAYEAFQKGMYFIYNKYYNTGKYEDFENAVKYFEEAIQLDSGYAEAYAGLAETYDELRNQDVKAFPVELMELKLKLARKALYLKPNSPFVNTAMAWAVRNKPESDVDSAFYFLKKAYYLDPSDPLSNQNLGSMLSTDFGLFEKSIPFIQRAIKEDPLDPNNYILLGNAYANLGKEEEAKAAFNKSLEFINNEVNFESALWFWLIYFGDYDRVEQRLTSTSSTNEFIKSYLHASKGEINKIHPEFRNTIPIVVVLNPDKVVKEIIPRFKEVINNGILKYDFLMNARYYKIYHDDQEFKKILAYAKRKHDSNLSKYGTIEVVN